MTQKQKSADQLARAEARFKKKEQQEVAAPVAMREYRNGQQAERDKTERLRALRLASQAGVGRIDQAEKT